MRATQATGKRRDTTVTCSDVTASAGHASDMSEANVLQKAANHLTMLVYTSPHPLSEFICMLAQQNSMRF